VVIDVHTHPPTEAFLRRAGGPYLQAAEHYFGKPFQPTSLGAMVEAYAALGIHRAVLLGWDAEPHDGLPAVPNDAIVQAVRDHPSFFVGFAGVDPRRAKAPEELRRCAALGLRGVKVHPSAQGLRPDASIFDAFWRTCEDLGFVALVHTGTTGWGAGGPGGLGITLEESRPLWLDRVAARHPGLRIVAAHAGWPWHEELLAIALHKPNVHLDVSGWLPKHLPEVVWRYANGPLKRKVLFGSDYPFVDPGRILAGLRDVLKPEVQPLVLGENAEELLT
jgi:uncharacterized protein